MSEAIGSASIELTLNRSKFNRDLRDLETLQLKPIALGVKLDLPQLQRQLKGIALESINVGLKADTKQLQQQLKNLSLEPITVGLKADTKSLEQQLRGLKALTTTLEVSFKADTKGLEQQLRGLKALTTKLEVSFEANTGGLERQLRALRDRSDLQVSVKLRADSSDITRQIGAIRNSLNGLTVPVELQYVTKGKPEGFKQKIEIDTDGLQDSIAKSVEQGSRKANTKGLFGSILAIPQNLFGNTIRGFQEGIGLTYSQKLTGGVIKNLEKELGTSLTRVGETVGAQFTKIGKFSGDRVLKRLGIEEGLEGLKPRLLETQRFFNEIIDTKVLGRKFSVLELQIGKLIDDILTLKGAATQVGNIRGIGGAIGDIATTPVEGIKERRGRIIKESAQKAQARSEQIQTQVVPEGAEGAVFALGGFAGVKGKSSGSVAERLQLLTGEKNPVVPIDNTATDLSVNVGEGKLKFFFQGLGRLIEQNVTLGFNADAIETAAQALAARRQNPDLNIGVAGYSAGGFAAQETVEILKEAGVKARGVGIGTPRFGATATTKPDEFQSILGEGDVLSRPTRFFGGKDAKILEQGGKGHKLSSYLGTPDTQQAILKQLGIKRELTPELKTPVPFELVGFEQQLGSLAEDIGRVLGDQKQAMFFKKTGLYQEYLVQIQGHRQKLAQLLEQAAGNLAEQLEGYDEALAEAETVVKQVFGVQTAVAPAIKATRDDKKPVVEQATPPPAQAQPQKAEADTLLNQLKTAPNQAQTQVATDRKQAEAQLNQYTVEILKEISRISGRGTPKGKKAEVVRDLLDNVGPRQLSAAQDSIAPFIEKGSKGGQKLKRVDQTDAEKRLLTLTQEAEKRINDALRVLQTAEGARRQQIVEVAENEINQTLATIDRLTRKVVAPETRLAAGRQKGRLEGLRKQFKAPPVDADNIELARVAPVGNASASQAIAVETPKIEQAARSLAEALQSAAQRLANAAARKFDVEPQQGVRKTLGAIARSEKGEALLTDLAVNTAGFAASAAGSKLGVAPELAGDLLGALAARQAAIVGKAGVSAVGALKGDPTFEAAKGLEKFSLLLGEINRQLQTNAVKRSIGRDLTGDLAGFTIGNGAARGINAGLTALSGVVPGADLLRAIPFKGAIAASLTVPKVVAAREKQLPPEIEDISLARVGGASAPETGLGSKLKSFFGRFQQQQKLNADKTYQLLVQEAARISGVAIKPGDLPKLVVDDSKLRAIGARALYSIKQNQIIVTQEVKDLLGSTIANLEKNQQAIADIVHEARHSFQFDFGRSTIAKQSLGFSKPGVDLIAPQNVSQDIKFNALRSAQVANQQAGGLLPKSFQRTIARTELDAYAFEKIATPKVAASVASQLQGQKGFNLSLPKINIPNELKQLAGIFNGTRKGIQDVGAGLRELGQQLDSVVPGASNLFGVLKNAAIGFVGFQVLQSVIPQLQRFTGEAIQAAIKLDNLKTALNFASGSSTVGAQNLAFVRGEVERLRVPLGAAQEGFVKLAASTRGTSSQSATQPLFTGIQSASTVLGLTSEESSGASLAFSQIASKGKVYTEELLQLQERIPGFMATVQRAMGLSGAELNKALQAGSISADEFLPKIARQLQVEFGGAAVDASKNAQSAIFNVQNKFLELQQSVGAAFGPALVAGANLLAKVLEGVAKKATESAEGVNKIAATLGIILQPIEAIGSAIAKIPYIGELFGAAMNAVLATVLVIAASVAVSLIGKLLALPAIAKIIAAGFSAIGGSLATAFAALPALLAKFFLLQLAVEAVTGALSVFVPSELGNQFKGFADQAESNLKRIEEAAKKAKGEVSKVAPPEDLPSEGPDIGKVLTFGLKSFKTDDLLKGANSLNGQVNSFFGAPKDFGNLTTVAEIKAQRDVFEADRFGDSARALSGQVFEGAPEIKAKLREVADLDKQVQAVQNQRALVASKPQVDKTELQTFDNRLRELNAKRETASAPLIEQRGAITAQLANAKAGLQAIDAKNLPTEQAQQLKAPFEAAVSQLEKAQAAINKFEGGIKTSVSAGRELTTTFTKLATELEEARRVADRVFNQSSQNILKQQFTNFTKDPRAAQVAAVDQAKTEQTRLQTQFDDGQNNLDKQKKSLSGADAQTLLGTIPIGNSGKTITIDSSLEEIEEASKGLADNETQKKAALESLKTFREGTDKQQQLGTQVEQSRVTVQKAQETSALTDIDRDATKRDNQLKQADNERAIPLRKASAALVRDKASNKFFSDADAGVAEADLGIKSAQNQVVSVDAREANTQQSLEDLNAQKGKISAEEFQKRQMALTTQLADLRVEKANAAAAVEEALAKKVEATNRKIVEGLELANQKASAAIQLSATNQTTGTKKQLLAAGLTDRNEKVAGVEQTGIDEAATQKRNALIQKEIADYKKLAADKRISGKELTQKLLGFNQELADNNSKLVDLQIQRQKQLRDLFNFDVDRKVAADNRATGVFIRNLERQKAAAEQVSKSLEISRKLTESKSGLQQAIAANQQAVAQGGVDRASKVVEIANKAETEQDPTKREGYEKIARSLGVSDPSDKESLLNNKQAAEKSLADLKLNALNAEFAIKQQLLELDLKRDKLQAEQAVREAQIAELTAKKDVRKAEGELKKALKEGDSDKIAEAQDNLADARQTLDLSQQNTTGAREGLAATGELEANARAKLGVERDTAFVQAGQERQNLGITQATERVEAGLDPDQALNGAGGGVTVSSAGVQSGNYASLGASPFRVGGRTNDDRGLRDTSTLFSPPQVTPAPDASSGVVEASGATGDRLGTFFDSLSSALTQRLDVLIELQRQDMSNPKSVTFNATDPVESYAQYQNRQTGNALRTQPAY